MEDHHGSQLPSSAQQPCPTVTVFVVDGHNGARRALVQHVDGADGLRVVGSCATAVAAIDEITRLQPRVAVVGGELGGRGGLDLCRALRSAAPDVSCVIVTTAMDPTWGAREAMQAGAAGFVVKRLRHFDLNEVIVRVAEKAQCP